MTKKNLFNVILLTIGALIWGSAFIFQDLGMNYIEPFTFNVFRCLSCTLFLVIVSLIIHLINKKKNNENKINYQNKDLIQGSIVAGIFTALAMGTQQIGILLEGAGRSGFITSLYIVFVPIIGLLFGKKVSPFVLIAVVFSLTGLYLININGGEFKFSIGSLFLLGCAIFYALQIIAIDRFTNKCDSIKLTAGQFLISGLLQIPFMFILESPTISNIISGLIPILYCGILSSGIGFTIQIYTQKHLDPTVASVIMSLESVFSIIFASIILKERYSIFEIFGCITIFISVILTQIPMKEKTDA